MPKVKTLLCIYFPDVDSIKSQYSSSVLDRMACKPKKSLDDLMPTVPPDAIDLLKRLLHFNPDKRLTAEQALSHPYVAKFHNPDEEPSLDYDIVPPLDDDVQLSVEEYRIKLYEVYKNVISGVGEPLHHPYHPLTRKTLYFRTNYVCMETL